MKITKDVSVNRQARLEPVGEIVKKSHITCNLPLVVAPGACLTLHTDRILEADKNELIVIAGTEELLERQMIIHTIIITPEESRHVSLHLFAFENQINLTSGTVYASISVIELAAVKDKKEK